VYRWHSAISAKDEKWTEELYMELFGKPSAEVSMCDLLIGLKEWEASMDKDPQKRPFAKLQRELNGRFSDDDLVNIMTEAIEDTAGASFPHSPFSNYGANNQCDRHRLERTVELTI
jgi:linoleate 10R-lipoxygenase